VAFVLPHSLLSHPQLTFAVVEANVNRPINLEFVRRLAHFIWQLQAQGIPLASHLRLLAIHQDDDEAYLAPSSLHFKQSTPPGVRTLFGMGTQRGYYDTNIEAGSSLSLSSPSVADRSDSHSAGRRWQPDLLRQQPLQSLPVHSG
jgi:hypothetical protein